MKRACNLVTVKDDCGKNLYSLYSYGKFSPGDVVDCAVHRIGDKSVLHMMKYSLPPKVVPVKGKARIMTKPKEHEHKSQVAESSIKYISGNAYDFKLIEISGNGSDFTLTLSNKVGQIFYTKCNSLRTVGQQVRCRVQVISEPVRCANDLNLQVVQKFNGASKPPQKKKTALGTRPSTPKSECKNETVSYLTRNPALWTSRVEGFGYHITRKHFQCSCCGREFGPGKGIKIELKDWYFCFECKADIIQKESIRRPHIIFTPMGNKR